MKRSLRWFFISACAIAVGLALFSCAHKPGEKTHAGMTDKSPQRLNSAAPRPCFPSCVGKSAGRFAADSDGIDDETGQKLFALPAGEELWVIAKPKDQTELQGDALPGGGELRAKRGEHVEVSLPLKHTDVQASIAGFISTVTVTQQYENPFAEKIEAVYVFPLPADAAVDEFIMTIGSRRIRGIIRERAEAEKVYAEARAQGYVASLLTQERPNVFTQSVANIEPGKQIDVNIRYFSKLVYDDGWYEFAFPLVVGPRFNPPGHTGGIGAAARGSAGTSGQGTEVQYLRPHERSTHDVALTLIIDAGVAIEDLKSVNHRVTIDRPDDEHAIVRIDSTDKLPNKDFVLRYKVSGEQLKTAMMTQQDERGGFFTLMLYPPAELARLARAPMEMIFLLDCSGSMDGEPIDQAKAAILHALDLMRPDDTFQIIRFSDSASTFGEAPVPASVRNVAAAKKYVRNVEGEGGTMMIEGIKAALDFPHDARRIRTIAFLTDGYIGNEAEILSAVHARLGASRIFSFGVGNATNRYLLDGLAQVGNGAVAYLSLNDDGAKVMDAYFQRISHPALTDIAINWGGLDVQEVFPSELPDLFVGRPVTLVGRYRGNVPATVRVSGQAGLRTMDITVKVDSPAQSAAHSGIAAVWARHKIAELGMQVLADPQRDLSAAIREVALDFGLMSDYTAFVAVDATAVTPGNPAVTVTQAVPVPDGVNFETTVSE
jgi:Ca-activated chloride channel family protein